MFRGIISAFLLSFVVAESSLDVSTTTGLLHGKRTTSLNKTVRQFLGVPYARAPVGNLRFKPPVEYFDEESERDSSRFAPSCYQPPHVFSVMSPLLNRENPEISEDCLYLNIYVPENENPGTPLSVMVWLAGEGFNYADPHQFDGSYLAVHGQVIVVTVNYRLSVFGFLSSLSDEAPGNVGLLDQRSALKWVKRNIGRFGGNSESVTLFGRFTGSMSASIHTFSPLSLKEKLFERVILQSGVPVGDWVFDRNPLNSTFSLAESSQCLFDEIKDVITCLKKVPAGILLNNALSSGIAFKPIYDYHLIYEDSLTAASRDNFEPTDIMIGFNNDEGSLCSIALKAMNSPFYQKLIDQTLTFSDFSGLLTRNVIDMYKENNTLLNKLAVYNYMIRDKPLREEYIQSCGEMFITSHAEKLADILTTNKNLTVYVYEFAHRPAFSIHPNFIRAGHGDDVLYTMALPFQLEDLSADESRLTTEMVNAVTNFAKHGDPNSEGTEKKWPQYSIEKRELAVFDVNIGKNYIQKSPYVDTVIFWHDIIPSARSHCDAPLPIPNPFVAALTQDQVSHDGYFIGTHVTLPTAEYMMVGLIGGSAILFLMTIVAFMLVVKARNYSNFNRL